MPKVIGLNGDQVAAYSAKQCNVEVVSAYPITPQTIIVEEYSNYVANGEVNTEFICVESEHSAMSACIGASLTGARVFTATASQGLALMHEMMYVASGTRCPIVMCVVNRALSAPINIHGDHSDMMGSRDCGWIQLFAENAQEAYDWIIQAFKIAEDTDILLPVAVNIDGFTISHAVENVTVLDDNTVIKFLPERKTTYTLNPDKPIQVGALALQDYYFEFKAQQNDALIKAKTKIVKVAQEYENYSNRLYNVIDTYNLEDADAVVVCMGSTAGTLRSVARKFKKKGKKIGILKICAYRPFPKEEIFNYIKNIKAIIVLDRALSFGAPTGPLCSDIISTVHEYGRNDIRIRNCVYGLGGRDLSPKEAEYILTKALALAEDKSIGKMVELIGVRE